MTAADQPTIYRIAGFNSNKSQWFSGLNTIIYMFSTLICVFTLDRIGRRRTLYWGSVCQGIFMFLAGGMTRVALDATAAGDAGRANAAGSAAAAFVGEYCTVVAVCRSRAWHRTRERG